MPTRETYQVAPTSPGTQHARLDNGEGSNVGGKFLNEKAWKDFNKAGTYQGAALTKALAAFDKLSPDDANRLIAALDDVEQQLDALLKQHRADKALPAYATGLKKEASTARKEAERAAQAQEDESDDKLTDPKLLLAQLNRCRREPDTVMQFAFMDADPKAQRAALLCLSLRTSGYKLFTLLREKTGSKTGAYGTAWVDGLSLMLQLDKPLSGLVKKIRAPVRACGFRIKEAVLWQADGTVFERDEAPDDEASTAPAIAPAAQDGAAALRQFNARLATLVPRVKALEGEVAQRLKLQLSEAGLLARKTQFEPGLALLAEVESVLAAQAKRPQTSVGANAAPPTEPWAQRTARLVAALKTLQAASDTVSDQMAALQKALKASGDKELIAIAEYGLNGVSGNYRVRLMALQRELQAAQGDALRKAALRALPVVKGMRKFIDTDPRVAACDRNPLKLPVSLRATLGSALAGLLTALVAVAQD